MGKRIALFGTSADPPTIGHEKILKELSKIYAFTISYVSNNPKKTHKEKISIRSHLLKTLIEDLDDPKILFDQSLSSKWAAMVSASERQRLPYAIRSQCHVQGKPPSSTQLFHSNHPVLRGLR